MEREGRPDSSEILRDWRLNRKVLVILPEDAEQQLPERLTDYSEDGVDLTLIRRMLAKTPAERLEFLESQIADIEAIRKLNAR